MASLNYVLNEKAPEELYHIVSTCGNDEQLLQKIQNNPTQVFEILKHMNVEGNEPLASRLLYRLSPDDLNHPDVKTIETILRNRGMLNREVDPDIVLAGVEGVSVAAHKSILALECPHFGVMAKFREFQEGKIDMSEGFDVYYLVVKYLYFSEEKRKEFVRTVDKALLPQIAKLSEYWRIEELGGQCDDELCNSLAEISIDKSEINDWLSQSPLLPKFAMLLEFINRMGDLEVITNQMQTPKGAAQLASKCTPEEIKAFSTLKSEFGKVCQLPEGAFGKIEWEKTFPVTIVEVPQLPANIHAVLEQEDPFEPDKKLKETCFLFLRPEKVILHEEEGKKELYLSFDGAEELAKKATNPGRRTKYNTFDNLRAKMNQNPVAKSGWVLIRKEVIPGTRGKSFDDQKQMLKGCFEVPKLMDAILLNIIIYASEGKCLYGLNPWTLTRCQEKYDGYWTSVGVFSPRELRVHSGFGIGIGGLSSTWMF